MTDSPRPNEIASGGAHAAVLSVAYVMTHYPKVAQTFIQGEITEVERHGVNIVPFAMNAPESAELRTPEAHEQHNQTTYLKGNWPKAVLALLNTLVRHPAAMLRLIWIALSSAGGDVGLTIRRGAHLCQAALLARQCRLLGIKHVHAHFGLAPATIAWFATCIGRIEAWPASFSFTIHGFQDFLDPKIARLDLKARDASRVVCVSDFTRSQLCRSTEPALWPRFEVVRCGIDLSRFRFRRPPPRRDCVTVLTVGRLSAEKGFGVLLEAIAQLADVQLQVDLVIVGDGPLRDDLVRLACEFGLRDRVRFTGELLPEDTAQELGMADIFCLPSFSEGLPVSIMEAMAVGVPVVATWIAGIPELAVDGVTALTVPPARADALAGALKRLATDPALALRLTEAARQRVEDLHDVRKTGARMAALLREMAQ